MTSYELARYSNRSEFYIDGLLVEMLDADVDITQYLSDYILHPTLDYIGDVSSGGKVYSVKSNAILDNEKLAILQQQLQAISISIEKIKPDPAVFDKFVEIANKIESINEKL